MSGTDKKKKFTSEETASFCEQIVMLLNSGIPLYEGAYILAEEVEDKRTKLVLSQVEQMLRENRLLYEALEETGAFPAYMVHMVQVGETTGKLEDVLRSLAGHYERDANVRAAVRGAVVFPMVLFAMMAVIMLVMSLKILPMFEDMFYELSAEVAASTRRMMEFGVMTGKALSVATCVIFALFALLILGYRTPAVKKKIQLFMTKFGPTRRLTRTMAVGQFISSLGLMTASGMEQVEAFELAEQGCSDQDTATRIAACREYIMQGESMDEAMGKSGLMTGREKRMIRVAMRTGVTDEMLAKIGKQYDDKIGVSLGRLSGRIETIMVVVLAVMVGTILVSVMLPLVSMISAIG